MKKVVVLLLSFVLTIVLSVEAFAKSSFGGRSGGGSSFSTSRSVSIGGASKPSGGGIKLGGSSSSSSIKIGGSIGTSSTKPIVVNRNQTLSSLSGKGAKGDAAGLLYKDFQTKSSPILPNRKLNTADIDKAFSPQARRDRYTHYYDGYHPSYSPNYQRIVVENHSSGYGIWDYMMFQSILDNVGDRQMYWNHMNDPAFQDWRRDADAACAAGDKDVCEKLADLDKEMSTYRSQHRKQDPTYVTPGVEPDIYESNNIDPSKLAEIKVCSGAIGSDYNQYASTISKVTKLKTTLVNTNGSVDNLTKMASGACDLGYAQDDLIATPNLVKLFTSPQLEAGMLVCSDKSNINGISDLKTTTVFIGSDQTGSQYTFDRLVLVLKGMSGVKTDETRPTLELVNKVANNEGCMFTVTSPDAQVLKQLDKTNKVHAVPIFTKDFLDLSKNKYKLVTVMANHYTHLTQEQYKSYGAFSEGGTDTIAVSTSLYIPQTWADQNKTTYDVLMLERNDLIQTSR